MTVWDNVAFPLTDADISEEELERRVQEKLRLVDIEDLADLMPSELSTGMKRPSLSPERWPLSLRPFFMTNQRRWWIP